MLFTLAVVTAAVVMSAPLSWRTGRAAGWLLALLYLGATAVFIPVAAEVLAGRHPSWSMTWVPALDVDVALRADGLGVVFTMLALVVGAVVLAYSARYLKAGERHTSFFVLMAAFTLAMVGLVLADDLYLLFVCWELTSLASFFLIARSGRAGEHASMRTLLMTYLGGLGLLVAVVVVHVRTGTTRLSEALASPVWEHEPGTTTLVAVLVAIAGFSKAAQFPFHLWLPDAMAAPTPVSAYLHAAAVVKAGIFVLMRFSPALHEAVVWRVLLIGVGLLTALIGARFALEQTDLKRLMAYSTVSQLGLIVATIGVGTQAALTAAVLHTIAHALFKSGLFMMVGVVDHVAHTRDMRRLPPLWRYMPVTFGLTVLGCASMAGIPPLLGFVSKEGVLTSLRELEGAAWLGWLALVVAAIASVMTFAYCAKIVLGGFVDGRGERELSPVDVPLAAAAGLPVLAGLPLGLLVGVLDTPVARAAEAAVPGAEAHPHLSLWHGVTPELVATALVIAAGTAITLSRARLRPALERPSLPFDGPRAIAVVREGLRRVGVAVSRPTSVDHPSRHLGAILASLFALLTGGLYAILRSGALPASRVGWGRPLDVVLLVLMTLAVIGVCAARARLAAVVSLSAVGILATVQILALGAPDVGLTQLLVESLTVIVIMLVLQRLPASFRQPRAGWRTRKAVIALAVGASVGGATAVLSGRRDRSTVSEYYLASTKEVSGGDNVVNVILVEFRALDTLGELAVLGMAGVAVVAIFSTIRHRQMDPDKDAVERTPEPALRAPGTTAHRAIQDAWPNAVAPQLMVRYLAPLLAVLSLLIFWRGHNQPGGGFIAALVASTAVGLAYLSTSRDRQIGPPRLPVHLIGGGVMTAVLTGLWGLVAAGSFLEPLHGHLGGTHLTSSMLFDVGVFAAVLGLVLVTFNLLGVGLTRDPGREETRERTDEAVEGELPGPLDTVRGERPTRVRRGTTHLATADRPREPGR